LFQQERGGQAVEPAGAVAMQMEAFSSIPTGGVFIDPGQGEGMARQAERILEPLPITAAMLGLAGGSLGGIKGKSHHQQLHPAPGHQGQHDLQVPGQGAPGQGRQGCDRDA